jgi:hypothetical protein
MSETMSPLKTIDRPSVFTRLHSNSIDKIRSRIELDSPVKTPSTVKTVKSNVEIELLLKHEISKIKKQMFADK